MQSFLQYIRAIAQPKISSAIADAEVEKVMTNPAWKGIPGIRRSLCTSLLTISASVGIGIILNPECSLAITVQGKVFSDADGSVTINGSDTGTNAGSSSLTLYAINSTGKVVAKGTVAANGNYTLAGVPSNSSVTLRLSNTSTVVISATAPTADLPNNWVNTGENKNGITETITPGDIAVTTTAANLTNQNFGIEQLPNTTDLTPAAQPNPNGTATVQVPTLAGTDPEDGALGSGKSFKIVTLPVNGKLTYNGSPVTAGQVIANYNPTLLKLDPNDGAVTVSFTYAAIDAAGKADSTPATVSMSFTTIATPATVPAGSICQSVGGLPGANNVTSEFGGTFGTLASGYRDLQVPPPGYTYRTTPGPDNDGILVDPATYNVTSQPGSGYPLNIYGPWQTVYGVNTGTPNDAFLAVNGDIAVGTFITQTITVQPNKNYEFGIWGLNVHGTSSIYGVPGEEPNIGVEISNGSGTVITTAGTGFLHKGDPWKRGSVLFNSGNNTTLVLKLQNLLAQEQGNDFYVDGMFAAECTGLPVGKVTGVVYKDTNGNGVQDAGEVGVAGVTVTLKDQNGTPVVKTTDSSGNYSFVNIAHVAALESYTVTVDATSTPVVSWQNTTPISTGGIVVSGSTVSGGNYGFLPNNANVLLVKRITAINGDRTKNPNDNTPLNAFVDDTTSPTATDDNNNKWVAGYLKGAIDAGKVKPGDDIEYTIYFLNAGIANASAVRICDRLQPNQTFQPDGYATGTGMQLQLGTSPVINLTNANDSSDRTQFIAAGDTVPTNCNITDTNANGTIVVDITGAAATGNPALTTLPGAAGAGSPNDSYGFFRFITKVGPANESTTIIN